MVGACVVSFVFECKVIRIGGWSWSLFSSYHYDDKKTKRFLSAQVIDWGNQGCGLSDSVCLEVGHNIRFSDFGQSS